MPGEYSIIPPIWRQDCGIPEVSESTTIKEHSQAPGADLENFKGGF